MTSEEIVTTTQDYDSEKDPSTLVTEKQNTISVPPHRVLNEQISDGPLPNILDSALQIIRRAGDSTQRNESRHCRPNDRWWNDNPQTFNTNRMKS
jgi:hypothetical protein